MNSDVRQRPRFIKCVVWDLDHTLWDGVLLENAAVTDLKPGIRETIVALDERGILHSIASRNDPEIAAAKLEELGIAEYFLHPQISWDNKSASVATIAQRLDIGIDTLAFVDDQELERDEVRFAHPEVLCVDAAEAATLADRPEFQPKHVTADSRVRRHMYRASIERTAAEEQFAGTNAEFLATLDMRFTISPAGPSDIGRAEELVVRTNQLNSTGVMYSAEELAALADSDDHLLLMAELEDRYGTYGQVGLALAERGPDEWRLKLLLMSCRVISRGVGTVLLNHVLRLAQSEGARLVAEYVPTDRNRIMYITYRFADFQEVGEENGVTLLAASSATPPEPPPYLRVETVAMERR
ncbi:HAD superfamily phosphatase (TIGR01681 family)/FkbH-like protein [Nocardia tenerifensis]|uniref:HAD superfamily phosphatase (TIGR01681 family)/FkbH-like protein n=1 Tax=Nocardia tenerifensis TaxID=228006 RepID=A0A318KG49_9NOCA|nr:HAD-IIIC family phosphatase [Nocardia tenerifensis]PXX71232.1 HAD superfamily phosphatase (TIGR01681 family)/FkbH-like protein [Nocardia tenerifensis]